MTSMTPPPDINRDPIPVRVENFPAPSVRPRRNATARLMVIDNSAGANIIVRELLGSIPSRCRALIQVVTANANIVCWLAKDRGNAQNGIGFPILGNAQATELSDDDEWHIGVPAGALVTVGVYAQFEGTR